MNKRCEHSWKEVVRHGSGTSPLELVMYQDLECEKCGKIYILTPRIGDAGDGWLNFPDGSSRNDVKPEAYY